MSTTDERPPIMKANKEKVNQESTSEVKKAVVWDETNLEANRQYQLAHPVTMHIDEPPTPYHHEVPGEEGHSSEGDEEPHPSGTWDPKYNAVASKVKMALPVMDTAPKEQEEEVATTGEQNKKKPRPKLNFVSQETAEEEEKKRREKEFKAMRKAVYADEGKKFLFDRSHLDDQEEEGKQ